MSFKYNLKVEFTFSGLSHEKEEEYKTLFKSKMCEMVINSKLGSIQYSAYGFSSDSFYTQSLLDEKYVVELTRLHLQEILNDLKKQFKLNKSTRTSNFYYFLVKEICDETISI
jgi:hypothetical protein